MTTHDPLPPPEPDTVSDLRPTRVTLRSEADLLALVPYTFGFHPRESLVMMLIGQGGRPMFARVDLPTCADEAVRASDELRQAAVTNGGGRVVLVAYTDHEAAARLAVGQAAGELLLAGFDVMLAIRADGERWWRVLPELEGDTGIDGYDGHDDGVPYDLTSHPITASGVLEGRVTHRSREELAESLLPVDPDRLEAVASAHAALPSLPEDEALLREEARWLEQWVTDLVGQPGGVREASPDELARVARALSDVELRDVAWATMSRADADDHVRLWTEVVVQCPLDLLAPAAGLLAFAAWLSGHGALAWCAVDRSLHGDPDHSLARLVASALDGALPPSTWEPVDRRSLRLLSG